MHHIIFGIPVQNLTASLCLSSSKSFVSLIKTVYFCHHSESGPCLSIFVIESHDEGFSEVEPLQCENNEIKVST